eukprot:383509_1
MGSLSSNVQRLCDYQSSNDLVIAGFIRSTASKLFIPSDIINMFLLYSSTLTNLQMNHNPDIFVTNNIAYFTNTHSWRGVCSEMYVTKGYHEWKLLLSKVTNSNGLIIGIASRSLNRYRFEIGSNYFHNRANNATLAYYSYSFGPELNNIAKTYAPLELKKHIKSFEWRSGDIVIIRLDLDHGMLILFRNNKLLTVINNVHLYPQRQLSGYPEIGYRLAIDNFYKGNKIKLLSYSKLHT